MKRTKRIFTIILGTLVLSLLVIANVWAFGVGNVDGVWSTIDTNGADCDGWASAGIPATNFSNPSIQSSGGNLTDENRVSYGDPAYDGSNDCPTNWTGFQLQSGFGFNGINGPVSGLEMDIPFYLGSFTHYNNPIYSAENKFDYVDLALTVPIDCNGDGSSDTSFSFVPRFALDETTNNANPCKYKPGDPVNSNGCADAVTITQPATTTFTCSAVAYTVNIYGFTSNTGCATSFDPGAVSTQYITKEQSTNNACLWAEIDRPEADAAVTKSCTNFGAANPYYTITVTNSGPGTALGAKIVDTLPSGVTFASYTSTRTVGGTGTSQGTCANSSGTVTCNLNAALPETTGDSSAKWEVKIYVNYASGTNWTNSVSLTTTSLDPNLTNNSATAACSSAVDVSVLKADGDYETPYPSLNNPNFDYELTVANSGPDTAQNVRVVDTLDVYTEFDATKPITVDGTAVDATVCSHSAGTITCNLGAMASGATKKIVFWVNLKAGVPTAGLLEIGDACSADGKTADVCNTVNVYTDSNDTNPANNVSIEPKDVGAPTAVDLLYFQGKGAKNSVILEWATGSELETLGFNLYRRGSLDGTMRPINAQMIQAESVGLVEGSTYTFVVEGLKPGKYYYFWLEDYDVYGNSTIHGPIYVKAKRKNP